MGYNGAVNKNRPFDSVAELNDKGILGINEFFLEYISSTYKKEKADEVIDQLLLQQSEKATMRSDKKHPFHGDEDGFDRYCRVKYKLLYDSIIGIIDNLSK